MKTTKKEESVTSSVEVTDVEVSIETMNLHQRLHAVMSDAGMIAKDGNNNFHKYKYASASAYIKVIRPLLVKYRLTMIPVIANMTNDPNNPELMRIVMQYTFTNIDKPSETIMVAVPSAGSDKGDKALFKAMTSAQKYMFAQTFALETGDDPEADETVDKRAAERSNGAAPVKAANGFGGQAPAAAHQQKAGGFSSKVTGF